jgi:hypothetical protein
MNQVANLPTEATEFGSKPFEEWAAYLDMTLEPDADSTIDWTLSETVVQELQIKKCCVGEKTNPLCTSDRRRRLETDAEVI